MDCPELDALAVELHARLQRGGLRGLPVTLEGGHVIEAELMARIVLADIEHIREWDRASSPHPTGERRLRAVGTHARQLLRLGRTSATLPRHNLPTYLEPAV
jgi:hypothetical protein